MADTTNNLPEGTDTIIGGASEGGGGGAGRSGTSGNAATTSTQTNSTGGQTRTTASSDATDALIAGNGSNAGSSGSSGAIGGGSGGGNESGRSGVRGMISNAGGKLRDEGKSRAHGLVSQGLERGGTTLNNISSLVEDTVSQIEERLGPQYGEYARSASQALNRYATTLQNKDPEELVEDARELVRKSPAVALTGAAILGFGLVRLLKAGIEEGSNGNRDRNGNRTRSAG